MRYLTLTLSAFTALTIACGSSPAAPSTTSSASTTTTVTTGATTAATRFKGEVWADNWFAAYAGDTKIAEDSVPITTERSFNAETFTFDATYPFDLNFVVKDYKQDDSGLEYIGTSRQQMGDGGFIMQITETATNRVAAVSNAATKCLVIHKAPLNPSCEHDLNPLATCQYLSLAEPAGWKNSGYDVSTWQNATVYTEAQVGVKEGYLLINWNTAAKLIWTTDLKTDNTLLCKVTVTGK